MKLPSQPFVDGFMTGISLVLVLVGLCVMIPR